LRTRSLLLSLAGACALVAAGLLAASAVEDEKKAKEKEKVTPPAPEKVEPTDFLRFVETEKGAGRLETALVTYEGKNDVKVDLIGVVHVAEKGYYQDLSRRFKAYDKLLYELVTSKDADLAELKNASSPISMFQRALKGTLGLEFQLDAIDYTQKNFVHADLDPETFARLQAEKGESLLGIFFKTALKALELEARGEIKSAGGLEILMALTARDSQRRLKYIFARELEGMEKLLAGIEEGSKDGSVLVVERNRAAIKALKEQIEGGAKKLGIFYGAAHMEDLEKRLVGELGMKKTKAEWLTAWDIERKAEPKAEKKAGEKAGETTEPKKSKDSAESSR